MKVLLVGPYPIPPRPSRGGIETAMALQARGLVESDHADVEVHVATVAFDGPEQTELKDGPIQLHLLRSRQGVSQLLRYRGERRWVESICDRLQPDIVHVHGTNFYGAACVDLPYPTVLTMHGLLSRESKLDLSDTPLHWRLYRRTKGALNESFEHTTLKHLDDVIAISPYIRNELQDSGKRLFFIPNPVADRYYALQSDPTPGRVLFVGTIHPRKGLTFLVRTAAQLRDRVPDFRIVVVGSVHSPEYATVVHREIERQGVADLIDWKGHVSDEELDAEYEKAALVVLPSQEETAPFAVQQAMGAGKAVVATRVGGVPEIVDDGVTGLLVPYGDEPALAAALERVLGDPELAKGFGAAGRRVAEERFGLASVARDTIDVYRTVIGAEGANGPRGERMAAPTS